MLFFFVRTNVVFLKKERGGKVGILRGLRRESVVQKRTHDTSQRRKEDWTKRGGETRERVRMAGAYPRNFQIANFNFLLYYINLVQLSQIYHPGTNKYPFD